MQFMQQQKAMPQKLEECMKFHLQLCVVGLGRKKVSKFAVAKCCQCQDTDNPLKERPKIELIRKSKEKFQDLQLYFGYCSQSC